MLSRSTCLVPNVLRHLTRAREKCGPDLELTHPMNSTPDPYTHFLEPRERDQLRRGLVEKLQARKEILFAYVFGSFLSPFPFRDVDVAVYVDEQGVGGGAAPEFAETLCEELSSEWALVFDVVLLNRAPKSFQCRVFEEGKLLFTRDDNILTDMIEDVSLACIRDEAIAFQALREIVF